MGGRNVCIYHIYQTCWNSLKCSNGLLLTKTGTVPVACCLHHIYVCPGELHRGHECMNDLIRFQHKATPHKKLISSHFISIFYISLHDEHNYVVFFQNNVIKRNMIMSRTKILIFSFFMQMNFTILGCIDSNQVSWPHHLLSTQTPRHITKK